MSGNLSAQQTFWATVLAGESLPAGRMTSIEHGDRRLVIYNVEGQFYATEDIKIQDLVYLSDGWIDGYTVVCPARHAAVDVRTGRWLGPLSAENPSTFPVRVVQGDVQVQFAFRR